MRPVTVATAGGQAKLCAGFDNLICSHGNTAVFQMIVQGHKVIAVTHDHIIRRAVSLHQIHIRLAIVHADNCSIQHGKNRDAALLLLKCTNI